MKKNNYNLIFIEEFNFLENEFGFKLVRKEADNHGNVLEYINSTTGIKIEYEIREAYISIMLYKLIDGKIIENTTSAIRDNKPINGFSLDHIINLQNSNDLIKPAYTYGETSEFYQEENGLKNYIAKFAYNLRKYGSNVLEGNFSVFNELDSIVKGKIKLLNHQK